MKKDFWTSEELLAAKCSQAVFGRLVGVSRARISQLVREGLISVDDTGGVDVVQTLKDFWLFRATRRHYEITPAEFFERFADKYEPRRF
ncbi:MAG: hypothetical protein IKP64_08590 [Selenomonadaceae bacterium]|nr:hypothetical protein [Selenomonadaceae bacterium]